MWFEVQFSERLPDQATRIQKRTSYFHHVLCKSVPWFELYIKIAHVLFQGQSPEV